jgi:hypothetical protein
MTKTEKAKNDARRSRWVVVATQSRPWLVACGRLDSWDESAGRVTLEEARCAVYFSQPTRSVFGCATIGPQNGSRVSRPCDSVTIRGVELLLDATPEAVAAWKTEPWT